MKITFEPFLNEKGLILLLLKNKEITFQDNTYSPLLYEEIAKELHLSKATICKHMEFLKNEGYVKALMKGRLQITKKGNELLEKIK